MRRYSSLGRRLCGLGLAVLGAALPLGCVSELLNVTDPDIILEANTPAGAIALKNGVVLRLAQATNGMQGPDGIFVFGGLLADEWRSGDTFVQRNNADQRIFEPTNTFHNGIYRAVNRIRVEGEAAIRALRAFQPDSTYLVGQMFAFIAYAETLIGEHYCNGTPLSRVINGVLEFGDPIANDSVFRRAVSFADSALANAGGNASVIALASIVKGRALVDLANFTAAATAVATVPLGYRFEVTHSLTTNTSQIWALNNSARRYTMADNEGGTGVDFFSANDPRLPRNQGPDGVFDGSVSIQIIRQGVYGQFSPVPIASGIEAKLIIAEALFRASNATWRDTLNALRVNAALYPPIQTGFTRGATLTALADPGTDSLRINALFRERAFWLFTTGHRLGDLRRLVRQYGRAITGTYPVGAYFKGGAFSDAVNFPVPFQETNNSSFTRCLDTNP